MYCKNCGKKMPDTAKFCTACGAPAGGGQSTKVMRTLAGADKGKRKNLSWIIAVSSAALVLVIAAAGLFILGMQKKTGFVVRVGFNVEDLEPYEIRYYYKEGKLVTGWFEVDDKRYYSAEENGERWNADGLNFNSFDWYEYGQLYENGSYVIDGMRYSFDDKGECIGQTKVLKTEEHYGENGLECMRSYNDAGKLTEEWGSNWEAGAWPYGTNTYSYDADGNRISMERYGIEGNLLEYYTYTYDTNGNQVKAEGYEEDGERSGYYEYNYYDRNGKLTKSEEGWPEGWYAEAKEIGSYDGRWNVTQVERWNAEGSLIYSAKFSYDDNKNLVKVEEWQEGDGSSYTEYSYNDNGNLVKVDKYDENLKESYEYDDNGNETKWEDYDENGNLRRYSNYGYDSRGKWVKSEWYDGNGSLTGYENWSYDGKGNLTKEEWYDENGNLNGYSYYSYDDKGNLTKEERMSSGGYTYSYEYICTYDDRDNLIRTEKYADDLLYSAQNYDSDGDIIKEESYASDGMLSGYIIYSYY